MTPDPTAALDRWVAAGGAWRVAGRSGRTLVISLCRCDGGEVVDQIRSDAPAVAAWVAAQDEGRIE